MYTSLDADATGLNYHLGPLSIVRFRVFRVERCLISLRRGSTSEGVNTMPQFRLFVRSLTMEVAARNERFDNICLPRRRMVCSLKPWRVVPVPSPVLRTFAPTRNGSQIF